MCLWAATWETPKDLASVAGKLFQDPSLPPASRSQASSTDTVRLAACEQTCFGVQVTVVKTQTDLGALAPFVIEDIYTGHERTWLWFKHQCGLFLPLKNFWSSGIVASQQIEMRSKSQVTSQSLLTNTECLLWAQHFAVCQRVLETWGMAPSLRGLIILVIKGKVSSDQTTWPSLYLEWRFHKTSLRKGPQ